VTIPNSNQTTRAAIAALVVFQYRFLLTALTANAKKYGKKSGSKKIRKVRGEKQRKTDKVI